MFLNYRERQLARLRHPVLLDYRNPLTRGIVAVFVPGMGNILNGVPPSSMTAIGRVRTNSGAGAKFTHAGGSQLVYPNATYPTFAGARTYAFRFDLGTLDNYSPLFYQRNDSNGPGLEIRLAINATSSDICIAKYGTWGNYGVYSTGANRLTANTLDNRVVVGVQNAIDTSLGYDQTTINGNFFSASTYHFGGTSGDPPAAATSDIYLGKRPDGVTKFDGNLYSCVLWNRLISIPEQLAWTADPEQIFAPLVARRFFLPSNAAAGGGNATGTWSSQLADTTGSWDGLAVVSGTWAGQLDSVTGTWTGSLAENATGTWNNQLADVTGSWTGTALATGTWSSNLADVTGSWTGTALVAGTWNNTLSNVTGSWDGVIGDVVAGSWSSQLANITDAWSGTVSGSVGSWSSQLDPVTGAWDGIALVTGTFSSQLADVTGSWDGSLAINASGTWNSQLEAITGSWSGAVAENATGTWNSQLAAVTGAWNGSVTGSAVYPSANQVLLGIQYGPTGADFTGTLAVPTVAEIVAGIVAAVVPVNVTKINSVTVVGAGTSGDLWRA